MQSKVNAILKPLGPDYVGAYLNAGVQLYDLIEWTLQQIGKSDITIMTFSISEEFIRKMWMLREMGLIGKITLILDFKAIQKTQQLLRFAQNVFSDIHFSKTHAKVVLIQSSTHQVSITGSQNCTRGNREESGIVSTNTEIYSKLSTEIERILCNTINQI
jgi:hypothetical protein